MCFSVWKSRVRGLQLGEDEGRPTQGTPTTGTQGGDRVGVRWRESVARDNGASVGRVMGRARGPPSSYDLPRLRCEILVESAGRILLCFLKIVLMIHVLNFIPVPRGHGRHHF